MRLARVLLYLACVSLAACGTKPIPPSDKHLKLSDVPPPHSADNIPQPSKHTVVLSPPKPAAKVETYSVIVTSLPARDILFALARDAKVNIDIHAGIQGEVTLNAVNQTLPQILNRIAKQVDMRYELENGNLIVMPDLPFLRTYKIDYVNMSRDADGGISNTSQIGGGAAGSTSGSNSQLAIKNTSKNHFWETLTKNITDILRETDKEVVISRRASSAAEQIDNKDSESTDRTTGGDNASTAKDATQQSKSSEQDYKDYQTLQAASVIASPEAGVLTVRATGKQHEKIQDFIAQVMRNARRQVLIEATIAEVRLNSNYQQGIDWSSLRLGSRGFSLTQQGTIPASQTPGMFVLDYLNPTSKLGNLSASVSLLESFGDVKVLSSPKISVMNNQTAMLRVVDNNVYFIVNSATTPCSPSPCTPIVTYTTTINSVPVGFSMSVTPQINDSDTILLNVRPTITRLLTAKEDPTPNLAIQNFIPQISTREMESVLKIENNQIAVLGGLMQDEINNLSNSVPLLSSIPFIGEAFKNYNDTKSKTELVIFLRPVVIKDASIEGDYREFHTNLPNANFLQPEAEKAAR